jgi:hypothetical protein
LLVYFLDNDVILKLAAYNLFGEMAACLKIQREDFRVLSTASQYFSRSYQVKQQYRQQSIQRAKQVTEQYKPVQLASPNSEYELLLRIDGIHVGEALLVAATQYEQDFYLLTGDKKFLKAIAASNLVTIKQRLYKRIVCLEQLMLYMINYSEFDKVCRRVVSAESCDQVINDAFSLGRQSKQKTVVKVLNQAVEDLRLQTGDLLVESLSCLLPEP